MTGKEFENMILAHGRTQRLTVRKIPEMISRTKGGRLVPNKTPYDFFVCIDGIGAVFDAKVTIKPKFYFKSIRKHQMSSLIHDHYNGTIAGILVLFYRKQQFNWFNIESIQAAIANGELGFESEEGVILPWSGIVDLRKLLANDIKSKVQSIIEENTGGKEE